MPHRRLSLLVTVIALWAIGCEKQPTPPPPPPPVVTVARPVQREVIEWDEYTGWLDAVDSVDLRARVSGLITSTPFQEGTVVAQGDLLVELDVRQFQAELDSRLAEEARSAAQVALADIEFKRVERVPPEARTNAEFDTAAATLRQAEAVLAASKAAVDAARLEVEWCRVTAPISGRISRKFVTPGNLITGGSGEGTLLTTITSVDPVYCYIDADEQSVLKYQRLSREGKRVSARDAQIPCFLQLADETEFPHEGIVDFVDNRMDSKTGTIRARGVFANPHGWLLPGLFARVRIPGSGRYVAMLVPDSAVTSDQNQKVLLVVGSNDIVQPRPVKLGALFGEFRAIESGITLDDRIVINGLIQARPGAKVNPHETELSMASFRLTAPGSAATQALPPDPEWSASAPATQRSAP